MKNIVRSAAGANLQTSQLNGKPVVIEPNSSLNQKFNIQPSLVPGETDVVKMGYVTIGVGGVQMVTNGNGMPYPKLAPHLPEHAALYRHIPFVARLLSNPLSPSQRAGYRLRRVEEHGGQNYEMWYAKVLDTSQTKPTLELRTVENGIVTSSPFSYTQESLSPTPPTMTSGSTVVTDGDYIASTSKIPFTLTVDEINEILAAANIIYGDNQLAIISEIGLTHGVDRQVNGDFNGVNLPYAELIGAQITNFIGTYLPLNYLNNNLSIVLDAGSVEPMLTVQQA